VKIDSNSTTQIAAINQAAQRAVQGDAQQPETSVTAANNSTVSLSAVSSGLRTSSAADVDTAKVASIKASIASGSYKIDSGAVADGMLSSANDLMQTKTPPTGG
jgi:negative regulator of flagellin synthesis FlgM